MEEENDAQQQEQDAAAAQKLKDTLYAINEKGVLFCMVESVGDREEDGVQALTPKKMEEVKRLLSSCHVKLRTSTGDIVDVDRNHSAHTNIDGTSTGSKSLNTFPCDDQENDAE